MPSPSRRDFVRRAALGGAGVLAGGLAAPARSLAHGYGPETPAADAQTGAFAFFDDTLLNFQALFAFGACSYGAAEFGELAAAVNRVTQQSSGYGRYAAFFEELSALGAQVSAEGDAALRHGHRDTARSSYLRATEYFAQALFFVLATDRPTRAHEAAVYRTLRARWDRFVTLSGGRIEPVDIPYERVRLPGWLMRPDGPRRRRPTLICSNGSDGQMVDMYVMGAKAAVERGYNALIFEGPGQGSLLFEHNVPFRPDWQRVITPVVDFLSRRDDVDPKRLALMGVSFSGELAPQAAAYEHRLAALIADPGCVDSMTAWRTLPSNLSEMLDAGDRAGVNREWEAILGGATPQFSFNIAKRSEVYGRPDFASQLAFMRRFNCAEVVGNIRAPTLVISDELEFAYPGQAQQLHRRLRAPKRLIEFTVQQGAQFHCEPMAPRRRNDAILDWLDTTFFGAA